MKNVVQNLTSAGLDWDREKWRGSVASKFIRGGEKNAVKYADEIIVLSKDVQKYFLETYGRETHFIPNGVNRPEVREAKLITDHFGLEKDSYILFLGRLVPEKGIRYLVEAFKNVKTDKKLVIAGGSSDTDAQGPEVINLSDLTINMAAMHRVSEIARYKPEQLNRLMKSKENWLLHEFIAQALDQFIDELAAEITKQDIMNAGQKE